MHVTLLTIIILLLTDRRQPNEANTLSSTDNFHRFLKIHNKYSERQRVINISICSCCSWYPFRLSILTGFDALMYIMH